MEEQENEDDSKWRVDFELESYRVLIKYNVPVKYKSKEELPKSYYYTQHIITDSRATMGELKTGICSELQIKEEEIILKRGGMLGIEILDLKQVIHAANMRSGAQIHLEFGHPAVEGEFRLRFSLATL